MINPRLSNAIPKRRILQKWLFPASVLGIYGILFIEMPDKAFQAFECICKISVNVLFPFCLVFILMVFLNLFLTPLHITKWLDKGVCIRGVLLTMTAGILSTGPIYAWYPLLKNLHKRGFPNSLIAVFLGNRSVKPFLLPVMISYFGWAYTLILAVLNVLGTLLTGYSVGFLVKK
ncbi:MAG: hypothetical protein JW896_04075 [Deltaproteobacteria bacterium]|nr:hypothetical protein [Deltaproteobacteria bacterium]